MARSRILAMLFIALSSLASIVAADPGSDRVLALEPNAQGTAAAIRVLRDYAQRGEGEAGFTWWMRLNLAVRSRLSQSPEVLLWRNRLEFLRDAGRGDARSCAASGAGVLNHPLLGCDYAQERSRYLACIAALPDAERAARRAALPDHRLDADAERCGPSHAQAIDLAREQQKTAAGEAGHPASP